MALVERNIDFTPDMSVRQTLLFHSFLREPGTLTRGRDTKGRINALIEDLGLSQVKHTRVADLTVSEKQRLNVACHLLLDTDIVLLDQVLYTEKKRYRIFLLNMEKFDSFSKKRKFQISKFRK